MKTFHLFVLALLSTAAHAGDQAFLDAPYKNLVHPRPALFARADTNNVTKNDVAALIAKQTAVKSQAARGSCSIFSATAILESMLVINGKVDLTSDLSEEYLQYLIAQNATNDGSNSTMNFEAIHERGMPVEEKLPYIGLTWKTLTDGDGQARCGHLESTELAHCLTGHRDAALLGMSDDELSAAASGVKNDVQFLEARKDAISFKERNLTAEGAEKSGMIGGEEEIKELLAQGIPVTMDIDFYYGAWNHRLAESLEINIDSANWAKGIVGYPERGSMDLANSNKKRAGHSVVIVGFDDEKEVVTQVKMTDGTMKEFKHKGVYYFKNSWGTGNFGVDFEVDGVKAPGYGSITQEYANEYGSFYKLVL